VTQYKGQIRGRNADDRKEEEKRSLSREMAAAMLNIIMSLTTIIIIIEVCLLYDKLNFTVDSARRECVSIAMPAQCQSYTKEKQSPCLPLAISFFFGNYGTTPGHGPVRVSLA